MIVLTVHYRNEKKRYLFNQEKVVVSTSPKTAADLFLEEVSFSMRFSIEKDGNSYEIHNIDNDPFISLNGRPFYKKQLFPSDMIDVDTLKVDFSLEENSLPEFFAKKTAQEESVKVLDEQEVYEKIKLPEAEGILNSDQEKVPPLKKEKKPNPFSQTAVNAQKQAKKPYTVPVTLRIILSSALLLLMLSSAVAFGIYRHYEEKSSMEAKNAARGIADIGLALVYAQLHHIQPPQQNWSDPNFLNRGINGIISPFHAQLHHVDIRGKLLLSNYFLRIYTGKDLNRFLVIAQPEPSIKQWLFSESSIVLDSDTMMIRKLSDLRALNRLLVNPDSLTELSGERISEILYTGDIVPLTSLSDEKNANGFAVPEELTSVAPQAAYYVYNAPRYSKVGEALLTDASLVASSQKKDPSSLKKLSERIEQLSNFPYAVLYTTYGKEQAEEGQKALKELFPEKTFLIGFTRYDYQKQSTKSALLTPPHEEEVALNTSLSPVEEGEKEPINADFPSPPEELEKQAPLFEENASEKTVDPLYLEIQKLSQKREVQLKDAGAPLIALLQRHQSEQILNFEKQFSNLSQNYFKRLQEIEASLRKDLANLRMQNQEVLAADLLKSLEALGLSEIMKEKSFEPEKIEETSAPLPIVKIPFEELLANIDSAKTIEELWSVVNLCSKTYALCNFCDIDQIIRSQRTIRQHVISKITSFLQDEKNHLPLEELSESNKKRIEEIIKKAWVYDPAERRYYLNEFDELKKELSLESI